MSSPWKSTSRCTCDGDCDKRVLPPLRVIRAPDIRQRPNSKPPQAFVPSCGMPSERCKLSSAGMHDRFERPASKKASLRSLVVTTTQNQCRSQNEQDSTGRLPFGFLSQGSCCSSEGPLQSISLLTTVPTPSQKGQDRNWGYRLPNNNSAASSSLYVYTY